MGIAIQKPVVVPPGSGRELKLLGVTHKLTGPQNGGAYYLCEAEFAPETGSRLHIHHYEDEVLYVLEGEIDIRLDNENLHVPAGGIVHLPKKVPHAFHNPLKTLLKIVVCAIPGGLENYFEEVEAALQTGSLDDETHKKISMKYGLEWLE
jgi:mannose-6-phosphate isomerase-like protein (cupin superfamily)